MSLTVSANELLFNGQPCNEVGVNAAYLLARRWYDANDTQYIETLDRLADTNIKIIRCVAIPNAAGAGGGLLTWGTATGLSAGFYTAQDVIFNYAASKGIKIIPTLFANYWSIATYKSEKLNQLGVTGSTTRSYMRSCAIEYVTHYLNHPALAAWEITNEWNNYAELSAYPTGNDYTGNAYSLDVNNLITVENLSQALADIATQIRSVDSNLAILSGNAGPWLTTRHSTDGYEGILKKINPNPIDTISVHLYSYPTNGVWLRNGYETLSHLIQVIKKVGKDVQKPVILGEAGVSEILPKTNEDFQSLQKHLLSSDAAPLTLVWNFYKPGSTLPDSNDTYDFYTTGFRTKYLDLVQKTQSAKVSRSVMQATGKIPENYLSFDGTQAAYLPVPTINGNFTLSFWTRTDGGINKNFPRLISATSDESTNGFIIPSVGGITSTANEPYFRVFTDTGGQSATARTGPIQDVRWKHYTYVCKFWTNTFTANISNNTIELTTPENSIQTGNLVRLTTTGTLPGGLNTGTDYYVVAIDNKTIKLASGQGNAYLPLTLTPSNIGTGTHTIKSSYVAVYQNGFKSTGDNVNIFTGNWVNPTGLFVIGANRTFSGDFYKGHIGNIRLWQRGLTELEVFQEYTGYTPPENINMLTNTTDNLTLVNNPLFKQTYVRALRA